MSDDKILDLLVKGREYFATHEWNRNGRYFAGFGLILDLSVCCGIGAVFAAAGVDSEFGFVCETGIDVDDIDRALHSAMTPEQKTNALTFYAFNDDIAESKDDVLAVFDRAIEARKSAVSA